MTRLITTDVLVAGLGPAGATAGAAIAAASGYQVIAVDRKLEAGVPVQCAEFVPAMIGREVGALATLKLMICVRSTPWPAKDPGANMAKIKPLCLAIRNRRGRVTISPFPLPSGRGALRASCRTRGRGQ